MQSMFAYPFKQLKVDRVTAVTSHENTRAQSVLRRLGFQLEGIIRKGFDGSKMDFYLEQLKGYRKMVIGDRYEFFRT